MSAKRNVSKAVQIGKRLRECRVKKAFSQIDIAETAGVSTAAVSLWERGTSTPTLGRLRKVARFLKVDVDYILTGDERKKPTLPETQDPRLKRKRLRHRKLCPTCGGTGIIGNGVEMAS